jgi:hypothetical protein
MNNLQDLNGILFRQIERLDDPDISTEQMAVEVEKSEAIVKVSNVILGNAKLALEAQKMFDEYGTGRTVDIPLLGISNQNLMLENKRLRQSLGDQKAYGD